MSIPLRVLFVFDAEEDEVLLTRQLRQGGYEPTCHRVDSADGLRSALQPSRGGWDVVLSDYTLRRFSGPEALTILQQLRLDIPVVIVSGTVGEEVAVESIQAGAADYVMKQNLIRFVPAVARAVRDAVERRTMQRQEARLQEQRSLLGMIYDNTSDALVLHTWDPRAAVWRLASWNPAALRIAYPAGAEPAEEDLRGRRLEDVVHTLLAADGAEADGVLDAFHRAAESGRQQAQEARLGDGATGRVVDLGLIPFFGPDGQSRHVLAVVRDITARKRAEADRREFEARLAQSRKMEALGALAGGVAHDFNNILTGILGFAEVTRRSTSDQAAAGFCGEIVQAANRARDLVKQILMFSRRQPAERRPVRLTDIAREAVRLVARSAPAAVELVPRLPEDVPYLLGDATQLHQVVMNLCTNAVQALGETGGTVTVAVEPADVSAEFARKHPPLREGLCVRLVVADTGPGMPQAVRDRLFEPFFTTKAPGVGTGLGLSVVHGVVQTHEGAIVVDTSPGAGTSFEVYLPAINSPSWAGEGPVTDKPTPVAAAGRRILFVDDEAPIARLAQVMLKSLGHTAATFGKPADGLAALRADPTAYDLVITDLTMPGMTGVDLARGVRAVRPDIPIILSSGYADDVPEETLKELRIAEVLPKPFQMQALGAAVARATGGGDYVL